MTISFQELQSLGELFDESANRSFSLPARAYIIDNYQITTHNIYSSHIAPAGKTENSAHSIVDAAVQDHAVHHFMVFI
ncbi:MAG: hypothetical protein AAF702_00130 [Chloroflexota bacterium]